MGLGFLVCLFGASAGCIVGILQWLLLEWEGYGDGWWVVASIIGWGVSYPVGRTVSEAVRAVAEEFVIFPVFGAMGGAITGVALIWLLR